MEQVAGVSKLDEPLAVRRGRDIHLNLLLLANRSFDQVDEICQRHGVSHAQYVALFVLCLADEADEGLPIGAVADGLLNRASDTTRLVDRLAKAGLAERLPNPSDRRGVLVRATAEGHAVFGAITPDVQELHRRQWAHLSAAEATQLDALLRKALWGDPEGPGDQK